MRKILAQTALLALGLALLVWVNRYGLFARMTEPRYEIEFQGSRDGATWIAYPFSRKPQDLAEAERLRISAREYLKIKAFAYARDIVREGHTRKELLA